MSISLFLSLAGVFLFQAQAAPIQPEPSDASYWRDRHEAFVKRARAGNIDVLFLGDSITEGWQWKGARLWRSNFAPLRAANFGIGGDRIEQVLWRVQNGELDGLTPKFVVLLIGTNNLWSNTSDEIADGHALLVAEIRGRLPNARIVAHAVFPRVDPDSELFRDKIAPLNARLANEARTTFLNLTALFESPSGGISPELMYDGLHLTEKGYELWVSALRPVVGGGRRGD